MMTYEWTARSGVHVVSSVPRDEGGGVRGLVAYLAYYMTGRGRSK